MRYYVYALIDPRTTMPRYIGKGSMARTEQHFRDVHGQGDVNDRVYGVRTEDVVDDIRDAEHGEPADKLDWIEQMGQLGFGHAQIARILARQLDEQQALTLESFLIRFWFGRGPGSLFNLNDGHHAERFRTKDTWGALDLDQPGSPQPYFVYVLRDPDREHEERHGVFYVGEGQGQRPFEHFSEQAHPNNPKATRLAALVPNHRPEAIVRMVARVETKAEALLIEALLIKTLYGRDNLTNRVDGHRSESVRPVGSLANALDGFDLARIVNPGVRQDREPLRKLLLAEGLGTRLQPLREAIAQFEHADFLVLDSGELGLEARVSREVPVLIKAFTRGRLFQAELRGRLSHERSWMREHFQRLGALGLLRADAVFIPHAWKGRGRMARTVEEIIRRTQALLRLALCRYPDVLDEADRLLLAATPGDQQPVAWVAAHGDDPPNQPPDEVPVLADGDAPDREWMLYAIAAEFPDLNFGPIRHLDGDLRSIEAQVDGPDGHDCRGLKVALKKTGVLVELRARPSNTRDQMAAQFGPANLNSHLRNDHAFLPRVWKGRPAASINSACERVALLRTVAATISRGDMDPDVLAIL